MSTHDKKIATPIDFTRAKMLELAVGKYINDLIKDTGFEIKFNEDWKRATVGLTFDEVVFFHKFAYGYFTSELNNETNEYYVSKFRFFTNLEPPSNEELSKLYSQEDLYEFEAAVDVYEKAYRHMKACTYLTGHEYELLKTITHEPVLFKTEFSPIRYE